jgi:hypothetical protein
MLVLAELEWRGSKEKNPWRRIRRDEQVLNTTRASSKGYGAREVSNFVSRRHRLYAVRFAEYLYRHLGDT